MKRNLLYYIYPRRCGMLCLNLNRVAKYLPLFNGRRIMFVALDASTVSVEAFKRLAESQKLDLSAFELRYVQNDPAMGEDRYFMEMLRMVMNDSPDECTFFAHAKGVSRDLYRRRGCDMQEILLWTDLLYELNLSSPESVKEALRNHVCAGAFFQHERRIVLPTEWFYAGTFFWIRHSAVSALPWHEILFQRNAAECWLGNLVSADRAFNFGPLSATYGYYQEEIWRRIYPELEPLPFVKTSLVTTCMNRQSFLAKSLASWDGHCFKEIIIVDWSSERPVHEMEILRRLKTPLRIVRVDGQTIFNAGNARNLGASLAEGEYLAFVDSDMLLEGRTVKVERAPTGARPRRTPVYTGQSKLIKTWLRKGWFYHGQDQLPPFGLLLVHKDDFHRVNGYSENMPAYGYEDNDIYFRLEAAGCKRMYLDERSVHHQEHDNTLRVQHRAKVPGDLGDSVLYNRDNAKPWKVNSPHHVPAHTVITPQEV